jgi:resuscitation-promoting factor RpfB
MPSLRPDSTGRIIPALYRNTMSKIFTRPLRAFDLVFLLALAALLSGCFAPRVSQSEVEIKVSIAVDGATKQTQIPSGSNVEAALKSAGVTLGALDKIDPPLYTTLSDGSSVKITRVREEFETRQAMLPFERQTMHNESMPAGATRLIQPGLNGTQEIITRHVYEDGAQVSSNVSRTTVLQPAMPEIIMVGVQAPYAPLPIPGKLVYIASGSAWLMESSTANRVPLVTSGDLDGRVLKLSPDGKWLLYTRKSTKPPEEQINTLWAQNIDDAKATPINLRISNVIHFADWIPGTSLNIAYSSVEPRAAAPGWQANNDLYTLKFGASGSLGKPGKVIEANSGGVYGWWGTDYAWSPNGRRLAYSRPDGVGLVSFKDNVLVPLLEITPLQTHSEWALIPGLAWGADSNTLFVVTHAPPPGLVNAEESPNFDLSALSLDSGAEVRLVTQGGMFAYPSASSPRQNGAERAYKLAYLQALSPALSETSGYRLVVMDRDGSNRQALFPQEGSPGLAPQTPLWAPVPLSETEGDFVAVIYQGNLYLVDTATGTAHQVTGDGLIQKIDWK